MNSNTRLKETIVSQMNKNNMERAHDVLKAYGHLGRDVCISKMVDAGLKATTAATYYVNLRKAMGTYPVESPPQLVIEEDERVIKARIIERFSAMEEMAEATMLGLNRALIVSGPPGLGKSYGIMEKAAELEKLGKIIVQIQGNVGSTGLYRSLFENRFANNTIVFDDADAVFGDEVSLNLLKASCDSTELRYINWLKEIKMEDDDGQRLPRRFEFEGSVIFITNLDFGSLIQKNNRLTPHLAAMMSRAVYLDLMLKTPKDYIVRIKQVLFDLEMYKQHDLTLVQAESIIKFIEDNSSKFWDLSLRLVIKIANLVKADPLHWQKLAAITCFRT